MIGEPEARFTEQAMADRRPALWRRLAARPWLLAGITLLPIYGAYLTHFLGAPDGFLATGFLQYDQPSYMANAREHFDGGFRLLYGLPFSPNYDTPEIYFQPQTLFLGLMLKLTGLDPGLIYMVFGLVAALVFFRIAIALYAEVVGLGSRSQFLVLLLFLWGGGVNVLAALALKLALGAQNAISTIDPFEGYWFFNLGRNAFMSVEAYYHALFLAAILLLVRRSYGGALVLMAVLSASHPFTGLELLAVVFAWTFYERLVRRRETPPIWFVIGTAILLNLHVAYYLVLLPRLSPEHASLNRQWTVDWILHLHNIIIDYGLVALAALWRLRDGQQIARALGDRSFGILITWFAVAFLLANHELFMAPRQPLHFTRGYIWTPLFLMGAPTLLGIVERLLLMPVRIGRAALAVLISFSLLDNAAWFGLFYVKSLMNLPFKDPPVLISKGERDVLGELNVATFDGGVILSDDSMLAYLGTVYTPLRAWHSHRLSTPYADHRWLELYALFREGRDHDEWRRRKTIALVKKQSDPKAASKLSSLGYNAVYENSEFLVFIREAAPLAGTSTAPRS